MTQTAQRLVGSYRIRLALGFLLTIAIVAGSWTWSLYRPLTNTVIEQQQGHLLAVAQAGVLVLEETPASAPDTLRRLVMNTDLRMTIVAADGSVIADSEGEPATIENYSACAEIVEALAGRTGVERRSSEPQGIEQIYVAVPASFAGESVALRVSEPIEEINALAAQARRNSLILLAAALFGAALLAARLVVVAAAPIERLSSAAQRMADGDLRTAIPDERAELATLSSALTGLREQMRRRLDELSAEKHNLRGVLDGLTDAVFLLHDETIVFANSAASRLFRAPALGWVDKRLGQTELPASVTGVVSELSLAEHNAVTEIGPDPAGRTLRISVMPLNPTDRFRRTLVVVSDTTDRTRVERMRRDFVSNASHELKTPVSAIHLLASSAMDAAGDGDTDQALAFAVQIEAESARLGRLVGDLLDLSRLEALPASGTLTDIREAITNALAGHRAAAHVGGLELIVDDSGATGVDTFVRADPTDVAIALDNLLDNAIKYTEAGSVTVRIEAEPDTVRLVVSDTGIGIPEGDLPRIFERFYRVDRARSRASGGTGLGLALVRHVVERSGGTVEVSSAVGGGTSFAVTLPRA